MMQYTVLGRTGLTVSRLGFGCMRFPMKSAADVDRDKAIPLLHRAVELGVTYFDTAVMYCAHDSQRVLGEAFQGMRDKVVISTKNHHYDKKDTRGWWKNLEDSLAFLRTGSIDVYNFHGMSHEDFLSSVGGDDGLYREALKAKEQGLIRHISHSFHGSADSLKQCVDTGLFESVTLQYNLLDRSLEEAIGYAGEHGMGVVVMGPVGGGRLGLPSEEALKLVGGVRSTPELALRFVLSHPSVSVALSGMSTLQQLEENVETVSRTGALTSEDHARITAAVQERKELAGLYCTGCNYCMPCPEGVDIPGNFEILNLDRVFGLRDHARSRYAGLDGSAARCRLCGKCVPLCPQKLAIPDRLSEAVTALDERAGTLSGWAEVRDSRSVKGGLLGVGLRLYLKNFGPNPHERVAVEIEPHREDQVAPSRFELRNLKAFGLRHKDLALTVVPPLETLSLDARYSIADRHFLQHLHWIVTAAATGPAVKPGARDRPSSLIHVPGPFHPALTATPPVKGHSFDFHVSYDARSLHVWIDAEDDLALAAPADLAEDAPADNVRVYLDGRGPSTLGRQRHDEGVMDVIVYPVAGDGNAAIVRTSNGAKVKATVARTPDGYRAAVSIPLEAFLQKRIGQSVIGFDIVLNSHDAKGAHAVRLSWTGHTRQGRDASTFGRLLLPTEPGRMPRERTGRQ